MNIIGTARSLINRGKALKDNNWEYDDVENNDKQDSEELFND